LKRKGIGGRNKEKNYGWKGKTKILSIEEKKVNGE
jgi:hypothetical protein